MPPDDGASRGPPPVRQRHRRPGTLLRSRAPALARSPHPGPPLRRAQHAALPGGVARRSPVARRRHRRDDGHADRPRRHLPQAAAALPASRAALEDPGRLAGEPDHAGRQRRSLLLSTRRWRETMGPSMAAFTSLGVREIRAGDRTGQHPAPGGHAGALLPSSASRHHQAPPSPASPATVSGPPPVILSYRVWQELFDRQPRRDRSCLLDRRRRPHTVIGVMPERFWFSDMDSPIWTALDPRTLAPDAQRRRRRAARRRYDARHARRPAPERPGRLRAAPARRPATARRCGRPDSKARRSATRCPSSCPTCSARRSC